MTRSLVFLILLVSSLGAAAADQQVVKITPEQQKTFGIQVAAPQPATETITDKLPAQVVVPNAQQRVVSVPVGGLVEVVLVAVGDEVKKGQVVARVQSPDLLGLQRDLLQTQTQLNLARTNLNRDSQLYKDGIIAERRYQESRSAYQELLTQMKQRRQALRLAGMSEGGISKLERGKSLSSTIEVTSPLDGVVMEQMAKAGQRVDAATPIYSVASLKPLWLEIHTPLERTKGVQIGDRVDIPRLKVSGHIITIGREIHKADQGVLLRAEVSKGAGNLRPGQFVQVEIACECEAGTSQYTVARPAIVRLGDKTVVFVKTAGGFEPQEVRVVEERNKEAVIAAQFAPGTEIAVTGTSTLKATLSGIGGGE